MHAGTGSGRGSLSSKCSAAYRGTTSSNLLDAVPEAPFFDYIVSITGRSRSRCLHMADGCYRARDFKFVQYEVYSGIVDAQLYDNVCMACWKGSSLHRAATAHIASPVSDCEDSSSSSTSSL